MVILGVAPEIRREIVRRRHCVRTMPLSEHDLLELELYDPQNGYQHGVQHRASCRCMSRTNTSSGATLVQNAGVQTVRDAELGSEHRYSDSHTAPTEKPRKPISCSSSTSMVSGGTVRGKWGRELG